MEESGNNGVVLTKKCIKCGVEKEVNSNNYYFNKSKPYGQCKTCWLEKCKVWQYYKKENYKEPTNETITKTCSICGIEYPATKKYFSKKYDGLYGLRSQCKKCYYNGGYDYRHTDKYINGRKVYGKKYYNNNKIEILNENKEWHYKNRARVTNRKRLYRQNNVFVKLTGRLRSRLIAALKYIGKNKNKKSDEYGINYTQILNYLGEKPNEIYEWEIDHILPFAAFDLSDEEQIRLVMLPINHQWLTNKENLSKGDDFTLSKLIEYIYDNYNGNNEQKTNVVKNLIKRNTNKTNVY